ncbi:MAG TPA: hypothetical protein VGF26_14800 [Ramlibacter sp.]
MDTLLGLRQWKWHATDWTAAAVSGFAAGAVLMVLDLVWSALFNPEGPWRISHMIAPIFLGAGSAAPGYPFSVTVVAVALATHYALGILFGLGVAWVMSHLELDGLPASAMATGAAFGVLLYLFNFHVVARVLFPWLAQLRGVETLAAHVVFGMVAALLYERLKRIPPTVG